MFIYINKRNWQRFLLPKWLNTVTYKETGKKFYRWLIFGWTISI